MSNEYKEWLKEQTFDTLAEDNLRVKKLLLKSQQEVKDLKELWEKHKGKIYECECGDFVYDGHCLGCDKTDLKEYKAFDLLQEIEKLNTNHNIIFTKQESEINNLKQSLKVANKIISILVHDSDRQNCFEWAKNKANTELKAQQALTEIGKEEG